MEIEHDAGLRMRGFLSIDRRWQVVASTAPVLNQRAPP
ncbi:hypothetical protein PRJ_2518 [Pseudomonas sp. XWY-1]|nr:hypothetical protein PRJ_2518 [Pseudomonas sp. XWY-1]